MNNLEVKNFTSYWDYDHQYGNVELFLTNGLTWKSTKLSAAEFTAMMSIIQFPVFPGMCLQVISEIIIIYKSSLYEILRR